MRILGKYHSSGIHKWVEEDGKLQRCPRHQHSCGKWDKGRDSTESATQGAVGGRQVLDHEDNSEDSNGSDGEYNDIFSCEGKPYQVHGKVLTCELHSLFEIECNRMAEKAKDVIDPVMDSKRQHDLSNSSQRSHLT